jgi:hypothetical protein
MSLRVFLLSPAIVTGKRAQVLTRHSATFDLAVRLRAAGAPIGEVFSFMSGLYFRGKLTYAKAFSAPPSGLEGAYVITSAFGLVSPERVVTLDDLQAIADVPVDTEEPRYIEALSRDAKRLARAGRDWPVVLLGSIATAKYVDPLLEVFGERLVFPDSFVGRGDLSRGGLLLRAAKAGEELTYKPVGTSIRRGTRPPKLERLQVSKIE